MFDFYLTPASISYLVQSILALVITGYLFNRLRQIAASGLQAQAGLLAGFFAAINLFSILMFFETSLLPAAALYALYPQIAVLAACLVFLLQFTYRFPVFFPERRREARLVLVLSLGYALFETIVAVYRYILLSNGQVVPRPGYADYPMVAFTLWVLVMFLRQSAAVSRQADPDGAAPAWRYVWRPQGRRARLALILALVYLIPFALSLVNILRTFYLVSAVFYNISLSLGIPLSLAAFIIVYLDHLTETTTFVVRLVIVTLAMLLAVLSTVGWVIAPIYAEQYRPHLTAQGGYTGTVVPDTFGADVGQDLGLLVRDQPQKLDQNQQIEFRRYLHTLMSPLALLVLGATLLVIVGLPLLLSVTLVRPLNALLRGVQQVNAGDYSVHLDIQHPDEVGFLTGSFNALSQQLGSLIQDLEGRVAERTRTLQESENRLRQITSSMWQVVWLRDIVSLQILYVNPAYETIWGRSVESFYADPTSFLAAVHPDDKERVIHAIRQQYEGISFNEEYRILRPEGDLRWVWGRTFPIADEAGEYTRLLAVAEDITERKLMEGALRKAKESAEFANRAKSTFLANMSHELRTPLNAILGFSELMTQDASLSQSQLDNIEIINRSGEHLLSLINNVLEISKIEAGHTVLRDSPFNLRRLLQDIEAMFRMRCEQKGLELHVECGEAVPRYILADHGKLRQVLINLMGNAVKFTQAGCVQLTVSASPLSEAGSPAAITPEGVMTSGAADLHFVVEDSGIGIAPEELKYIFDPFFQTESGRRLQQGTGLGLSISRQYVELMGGQLEVSSEVGLGSIFCFDLLVQTVEMLDEPQIQEHVVGLEPGQPIYRLLIVEDMDANRLLLVKILQPLGFDLRQAVNGQQALEIWQEWQPHLIFMDLRMPVMDGYEAIRCIRAASQGRRTLIIALTASVFDDDRAVIAKLDCDDFIRKPFRQRQIFRVLGRHLGVRFRYAESKPGAPQAPEEIAIPQALISELPEDWKARLRQATLDGDMTLMVQLLGEIEPAFPEAARLFQLLVYNFEYERIRSLLGLVSVP